MVEARYKNMWTFLINSNYGDDADIGSDMKCTICTRILINAHNSICGCRYCLECVKAYLNGERRFCPGNADDCKAEELDIDSNIYPDHTINNKISKLVVTCRYSCGYRCELRNTEEHEKACQRQSVHCPYVNVGCRETKLINDRINEHLVGENELHAKLLMACIDRLESEIAVMKRDSVELRSEMAQMILAGEIDEGRARETNRLVDQIKQEVTNLRNDNQLAKEKNNFLKAEIQKYRKDYLGLMAAKEQQLVENRTREQTQAREVQLLTEKYSCSEKKLDELERQTRKEKEELLRNIDKVREKQERVLVDVEKRVREIGINFKMQNLVEFVWPIDRWTAKRQSARDGSSKQIFSEAFYSHKNGYKMCLSVYPDGYGPDKGTHLCVFFHLMRGPFDNILSWPFIHEVTLYLVDQHTGLNHISDTSIFNDFPNDVYWTKPSTERNAGFGNSKLIELAALSSNSRLCRDNILFIRCIVKI